MPPVQHPIYPDWPACPADLVPLPLIEGPKLKPFDFGGPQQIEFLKYIASGLHGHVVKARIHGQEYAIKLFRYVCTDSWYGPLECYNPEREHKEPLMALAPYSEPFYAECRAFGRLHETGRADLALDCYGYVLPDEAHERALNDLIHLEFNGDVYHTLGDVRGDFCGPSGRPPPLRGIVKALGRPDNCTENVHRATARRLLDDIMQMQQLGIVNIDGHRGQYIDWKFADFSTALTTPHFLTTPEILTGPIPIPPAARAAVEYQLFIFCITDYWDFQCMLTESNNFECTDQRKRLELYILQGRNRYILRRTPRHRNVVYTLVDPRRFDWRAPQAAARAAGLAKRPTKSARTRAARLSRWYYPCSLHVERFLRMREEPLYTTDWAVRDGCIFPAKRFKGEICHKLNKLLESNGGDLDLTVPENKALVEADKEARFMFDETYMHYYMKPLPLFNFPRN